MAFNCIFRRDKSLNAVPKGDTHFVMFELALQEHGHLLIQLRQHLILQFNQFDRQPLVIQLLRHFQADKAGADGYGTHSFVSCFHDAIHVFE